MKRWKSSGVCVDWALKGSDSSNSLFVKSLKSSGVCVDWVSKGLRKVSFRRAFEGALCLAFSYKFKNIEGNAFATVTPGRPPGSRVTVAKFAAVAFSTVAKFATVAFSTVAKFAAVAFFHRCKVCNGGFFHRRQLILFLN